MKRVLLLWAAVTAGLLGCAGSALAAGGVTLCSAGAGKPVLAALASGKCASGQHKLVLVSERELTALQHQIRALQTQNQTLSHRISTLEGQHLNSRISTLEGQSLNSRISTLQSTFSGVSRSGSTLLFTGMNLQLENGLGATNGDPNTTGTTHTNGLGNLIIGYNENPGSQTGSHNLVLGNHQSFTSYGGLIAGQTNTLSGPFSDVFGTTNTANNYWSSVTGGFANTASGLDASVIGGESNTASGNSSTARGGISQTVTADDGVSP